NIMKQLKKEQISNKHKINFTMKMYIHDEVYTKTKHVYSEIKCTITSFFPWNSKNEKDFRRLNSSVSLDVQYLMYPVKFDHGLVASKRPIYWQATFCECSYFVIAYLDL
ncbi:hypothetical protein ACJX0J_007615, partial [Zea mays]